MTAQHPRTPEPETALRGGLALGDPAAVRQIVEAFFEDVVRFCVAMTGNADNGLDAAQETFLRLFELHRRYDPSRAFRPWLFGIARTCCLEVTRKGIQRAARIVDMEAAGSELERLESGEESPIEKLLREELERDARALLVELDELPRSIVLMRLYEDLTFREIAEALERPLPTIATTYYRAIEDMRRAMPRLASWRERKEHHHGS